MTSKPTVDYKETFLVENIQAEGLLRLGVTREQIAALPRITPQMQMIVKTIRGAGQRKFGERLPYGPGTDLNHAWPNYLGASDVPEGRKVLDVYYSIPKYMRRRLPIEAFCAAAGVSSNTILELITAVLVRQGVQASAVIAAVNHPRVVAKSVEMALTDEGISDRIILHKHSGFLPTPKGPSTSVVVTQNASATAQAASVAAPPPEQTIRRLADRFNLARTLPEQVTTPMPERPIEAELVEVERTDEDE